jgi:uncharacterized lipoprotein YddW (UPF0748 family)
MEKLFDSFAAAGINVVFVETINAGYPIYPSQVAYENNPQTQDWDRLATAIQLGHERQLEIHAWIWTFAIAHQRHNPIIGKPDDYLGPVLSRHPQWGMIDLQGNYFRSVSQKAFLDPGNPEAVSYLLALIEEIVTKYNLDGLQLDYIRYPFQNLGAKPIYGYGFESRVEFWEQTNVDPAALEVDDPLWQEWTEFRTEQITKFVGEASRIIKKLKPQLTISAAVFPYPRWERVARIQQDWEQWIEEGYIDWLVPMTYAENTAQLATMVEPLVEKQGKAHETLIVPAVRLEPGQGLSNFDQIEMTRELSFQGYALFAANGFSVDLQQILSQTQGRQPLVLPHRQPLTAAAMKFATLRQEWSFYLDTEGAQSLPPTLRADWQDRSDRVEQQLRSLAADPSMKNLIFTQIELQSLQEQFNQWPLLEELYQRSIWAHHLRAISQLLAMYEQNLDRDYFK